MLLLPSCNGQAAEQEIEKTSCQYAEKDGEKLFMDIYSDASAQQSGKAQPVLIFSFGGGWENGSRADGKKLLKDCASRATSPSALTIDWESASNRAGANC